MEEVRQFRQSLRLELKTCERCRRRKPALHELTQGHGKRDVALDQRSLIIGLCWDCHRHIHTLGTAGKVLGLAILMLRRPQDFDLPLFWKVNGRRWPEQEDVDEKLREARGER